MTEYNFTTHWHFDHPLEKVWDIIRSMDHWPDWWKYVKRVEKISEGPEGDIGTVRRIKWSTALPYSITFDSALTSVVQYKRMEGMAFGDLTGIGVWTFEPNGTGTNVRYDWKVNITKPWMKFLEPVLKPVFKWNHDKVMQAGYTGLLKKLDAVTT
jgi:hypothetical protein